MNSSTGPKTTPSEAVFQNNHSAVEEKNVESESEIINDTFSSAASMPIPRILGSSRTVDDVVLSYSSTSKEEGRAIVAKVCSPSGIKGGVDELALFDLEKGIRVFANRNSAYVNVEEQDFAILVEEVLNNSILSVLVFANESPRIGDFEICALSRAMEHNVSVEVLTLSGLQVSDDCICLLCESLVRSRVSFLDFSNSSLLEDAGSSIAALAHINPYLRTVVVTGTFIPEDIQDEIDTACQFNQSNYEANGRTTVEESLLFCGSKSKSSTSQNEISVYQADRFKRRLVQVIRAKEKKVWLCVAHLFDCCPDGESCLYSHNLTLSHSGEENIPFSQALEKMFGSGNGWEEALAPLPQEGASWRAQEDCNPASFSKVKLGKNEKPIRNHLSGGVRMGIAEKLLAKRQEEEARNRSKKHGKEVYYRIWVGSMLVIGGSWGLLLWSVWRNGRSANWNEPCATRGKMNSC